MDDKQTILIEVLKKIKKLVVGSYSSFNGEHTFSIKQKIKELEETLQKNEINITILVDTHSEIDFGVISLEIFFDAHDSQSKKLLDDVFDILSVSELVSEQN